MKRTQNIDENERLYEKLTRVPHKLNPEENKQLWDVVYKACWSLATTITRGKAYRQDKELFEERVMDAVIKVINYIQKQNPRYTTERRCRLVTVVYWDVYSSFFGPKAVREDEQWRMTQDDQFWLSLREDEVYAHI